MLQLNGDVGKGQIGFSMFPNKWAFGQIPENWDIKSLSSVFKERNETSSDLEKYPLCSLTIENGLIEKPERYNRSFLLKNKEGNQYRLVYPGDFLFNPMNLRWGAIAISKFSKPVVVSAYYNILEPSCDAVPANLLFSILKSPEMLKVYDVVGKGTLVEKKRVHLNVFLKIPIAVPNRNSCEKIAEILGSVDDAIAATQAVIDQTRKVKQGLLQQLLTRGIGHTKFKETAIGLIPESWSVSSIGQVCEVSSGGTPDRSNLAFWNGDIPWVKTGEINYIEITDTEEKITQEGLENSSAKIVPVGTLLMAMYGQGVTRGRVAILKIEAAINQACLAILPGNKVRNQFLYYFLTREYENLRDIGNETTQKNLNAGLIKQIQIPIPSVQEQEQIIQAFAAVDATMTSSQKEIQRYQILKQGLMQDLLTGRVRVRATA